MIKALALILILTATQLWAQPDTEVYLVDIIRKDGKIALANPRNISNNVGYDNQPFFYDDNTILFSSARNGQTDIASYNIDLDEKFWISNTPGGSEYSPLRTPDSEYISAILLDTTGLQRLYSYSRVNGLAKEILKDQKVGYHLWYSKDILVTTVLIDDRMDLVVSDLKNNSNDTVVKNVGRSLQKIPNSNLVSFIDKADGKANIMSLNPISHEIQKISPISRDRQDLTWFSSNRILIPKDDGIIELNTAHENLTPRILHHFPEKEIHNLTRIAISPDGLHMALVSAAPPEEIVQKQVTSFNAMDLDTFASCYAENVIVLNFPADTLYTGNSTLKANYRRYFENSPKTTVEVVKRIQIGDIVIDKELVRRSGRTNRQAAIYQVSHGKITSMTFVHEKETVTGNEEIIDENLIAYNERDIDAFLTAYSEDIKLYNYPNGLTTEGRTDLEVRYSDFFERVPDLNCEIKTRMVIGNKVIDEEYITANGNSFSAVAIYEIENGKISKVTFIR